jgi:hypothetical protein
MKVIAVNGRRYSADVMRAAVKATKSGTPLELLVENEEFFKTHRLDYKDGLRYPALIRSPGVPDMLDKIFAAQSGTATASGR